MLFSAGRVSPDSRKIPVQRRFWKTRENEGLGNCPHGATDPFQARNGGSRWKNKTPGDILKARNSGSRWKHKTPGDILKARSLRWVTRCLQEVHSSPGVSNSPEKVENSGDHDPPPHEGVPGRRSAWEDELRDPAVSVNSYWDPQFKGSAQAFPRAEGGGSSFSWGVTWVPWIAKKHPRGGQPLRSQLFELGGVGPLQLWFWPAGTAISKDGFSSVKLVSRPGWCLPFPVVLEIRSQYSSHSFGPFCQDSGCAVDKLLSFCRLKPHSSPAPAKTENEIFVGPAGNIEILVSVGDAGWQWEKGASSLDRWLKKQSVDPDDEEIEAALPSWYTHSDSYEDRHYSLAPSTILPYRSVFLDKPSDLYKRFEQRSF